MRPLKFLADLPWWKGLPIYLIGTAVVVHLYPLGLIIALFESWTFYKLIKPDSDNDLVPAIIGFPLFFLVMLIPERFSYETPILDLLNHISPTVNFGVRSAFGLVFSFIAFRSFR